MVPTACGQPTDRHPESTRKPSCEPSARASTCKWQLLVAGPSFGSSFIETGAPNLTAFTRRARQEPRCGVWQLIEYFYSERRTVVAMVIKVVYNGLAL